MGEREEMKAAIDRAGMEADEARAAEIDAVTHNVTRRGGSLVPGKALIGGLGTSNLVNLASNRSRIDTHVITEADGTTKVVLIPGESGNKK